MGLTRSINHCSSAGTMAQDSTMHHSSAIVNEIILTFGARQVYDKTSSSFVYSSRFLLPTLDSEHSVSLDLPKGNKAGIQLLPWVSWTKIGPNVIKWHCCFPFIISCFARNPSISQGYENLSPLCTLRPRNSRVVNIGQYHCFLLSSQLHAIAVSTGKERQTLAEILSFLSQGHVTIVAFVARRV